MININSDKLQKKVEEERELRIEKRKQEYLATFETAKGKAVLKDLISFSGFDRPFYNGETSDMIFSEGQKAVIRYILDNLEYEVDFKRKTK